MPSGGPVPRQLAAWWGRSPLCPLGLGDTQGWGGSEQGLSALPGEGGKLPRRGDVELRRGRGSCQEVTVGRALRAGGTACAVAQRPEASFGLSPGWEWREDGCEFGVGSKR